MDIFLNINVLLEMHNGSAVTLFGTIFVDDIEQNHAVGYLFIDLLYYINISHLQTPLIIIKAHSPDRDLLAHRKRERVSEFSRLKITCKCDTFCRNLQK